jgi:hypothetical protein
MNGSRIRHDVCHLCGCHPSGFAILRDARGRSPRAPQDEGRCLARFSKLGPHPEEPERSSGISKDGRKRCDLCHLSEKGHLWDPPSSPDERSEIRVETLLSRRLCGTAVPDFGSPRKRAAALHPGYVIYARNVIYEAAVARTASSASGVSTSSSAPVSVGTSATAS